MKPIFSCLVAWQDGRDVAYFPKEPPPIDTGALDAGRPRGALQALADALRHAFGARSAGQHSRP